MEGLQHAVNEDKVTGKQAVMRQMQVVQNTEEGKLSARQTSKIPHFPVVILVTNHKRATSGIVFNTTTHQAHPPTQLKAPKHSELPTHSTAQHLEKHLHQQGRTYQGTTAANAAEQSPQCATDQPALPTGQHCQEKIYQDLSSP